MICGYSAEAVRAAEAPYLADGEPLMERAAFALAQLSLQELRRRGQVRAARVVVLAGNGNNGADGILAATHLARRGAQVIVVPVFGASPQSALDRIKMLGGRIIGTENAQQLMTALCEADLVFDAMIGTGCGSRPVLRSPARELVVKINQHWATSWRRPTVVAVDVPSGVDPTTGEVLVPEAVLGADITVTFGAAKSGLMCDPGAGFAGQMKVVDLGIGHQIAKHMPALKRLDLIDLHKLGIVATPDRHSHKYTRGVLGVVAGSQRYPGAAVLAVSGALRTGIGMVRYLGSNTPRQLVLTRYPEVVTESGRIQALLMGPGIPDHDDLTANGPVQDLLSQGTPLVLDAGAIQLVWGRHAPKGKGLPTVQELPAATVVTPHAGELVQLLQTYGVVTDRAAILASPLQWARRAQELTGSTVLLKGATTVVAGTHGAYSQDDGPSWLATAGAGDVLAGVIGALVATHAQRCRDEPEFAATLAAAGALIHGRAAQLAASWHVEATGPIIASDIVAHLPQVIADALYAGQSMGQ